MENSPSTTRPPSLYHRSPSWRPAASDPLRGRPAGGDGAQQDLKYSITADSIPHLRHHPIAHIVTKTISLPSWSPISSSCPVAPAESAIGIKGDAYEDQPPRIYSTQIAWSKGGRPPGPPYFPLDWEKQKRNYLFLDIFPSCCAPDCCARDLTARGEGALVDMETYRSRPRRSQQRLGFCRNGGLLCGIQKKQPGNRTEKTTKGRALSFCLPFLAPSIPDSIEKQTDRSEHLRSI
jgi:hypothetical protein